MIALQGRYAMGLWSVLLATILFACSSTPEQRVHNQLLWNTVLVEYGKRIDAGKVDKDERDIALPAHEAYVLAAKGFKDNPEDSACKMATNIMVLANIVGVEVPPIDVFCGAGVSEVDLILAGNEAEKVEGDP